MDLQQLQIDRQQRAPSARRRNNPWLVRGIAAAVVAAAAWLFGPAVLQFSDRLRLPLVRTAIVRPAAAAAAAAVTGTAANGYVVAARRAALSSDVPGRIVAMHVEEGSVVQRGFVVAQLYAEEYRAALVRATADVAVAAATVARARLSCATAAAEEQQQREQEAAQRALVAEATVQATFAAAERARAADLLAKGIGSARDVERASSEADAAAARLQSVDAALRAATAQLATTTARARVADGDLELAKAQEAAAAAAVQQAQVTLDKTDVRAPFDGIVVLKDAEVGEVVSPNVQGGGNARGAVCTMVDFGSLEVQANVAETTLGAVRIGGAADVFLDALPDRRLRGRVDRIWPVADRQKATVEVRIELLDRPAELRPDMGVRVVFLPTDAAATPAPTDAPAAVAALLVAESALVEVAGRTGAFVVERDTVRFVEVRVLERKGGRAAIDQGLRPGQVLVLDPPPTLADGNRVRIADS